MCVSNFSALTLYSGTHPADRRFVFSPDMLSSMMAILPPEKFRPHLEAVERTLLWAETHEKTDVVQQSPAVETEPIHYIVSQSVLYTLYSVKKCIIPALRAFRGRRSHRAARRGALRAGPPPPARGAAGERGGGAAGQRLERLRLQLHFE